MTIKKSPTTILGWILIALVAVFLLASLFGCKSSSSFKYKIGEKIYLKHNSAEGVIIERSEGVLGKNYYGVSYCDTNGVSDTIFGLTESDFID
jgi:hypothetical protein